MKTFDWEFAKNIKNINLERLNWLFENHMKPITEAEYIVANQALKKFARSSRRNRDREYTPSCLRGKYRNLRKNFGFFPTQ